MKKILTYLLTPALAVSMILSGCNTLPDSVITTASTVATATGLRLVPLANRTQIANLVDYVATQIRTVTGNPTPEQLRDFLIASVPANIRAQYPELITFIIPIVIDNYQIAYNYFGQNAVKLYKVLNDIATGLEAGAAPYINHAVARCNFVEMTFAFNQDKEFRQYITKVANDLDKELAIATTNIQY